jgi:hypothetical protein
MKYVRGSFITVPNKDIIRGQSPSIQALFVWLCHYANTTGECFPSFETLAKDCGMSRRSVIRSMAVLVEISIVEKAPQSRNGHQTTNLYSINLGVPHSHPYPCQPVTPRGATMAHRTQSKELNPYEHKKTLVPKKKEDPLNALIRERVRSVATASRVG